MHLFTYGTLMFPAVWRHVVGRECPTVAALVRGYEVRRAAGELFPVMFRGDPRCETPGLAYFDVDAATLRRLDEFESELYQRTAVTALLADGRTLECQAYLLPEPHRRFAGDEPWTAEWFQQEAMAEYLRQIGAH